MNNFATMSKMLKEALVHVSRLEVRYQEILAAQEKLEKQTRVDASPYWHADKYLYLIYRTNQGYRPRKYIGKNPEKVAEALAAIERHKEHAQRTMELKRMTNKLFEAQFNLQVFVSKLKETER